MSRAVGGTKAQLAEENAALRELLSAIAGGAAAVVGGTFLLGYADLTELDARASQYADGVRHEVTVDGIRTAARRARELYE